MNRTKKLKSQKTCQEQQRRNERIRPSLNSRVFLQSCMACSISAVVGCCPEPNGPKFTSLEATPGGGSRLCHTGCVPTQKLFSDEAPDLFAAKVHATSGRMENQRCEGSEQGMNLTSHQGGPELTPYIRILHHRGAPCNNQSSCALWKVSGWTSRGLGSAKTSKRLQQRSLHQFVNKQRPRILGFPKNQDSALNNMKPSIFRFDQI